MLLSLLFPVASPLLLSLFLGVVIRESDLPNFYELFSNTVLYGSTFFLGLLLGVLCEAGTIPEPGGAETAGAGHSVAADFRHRRDHRRLRALLLVRAEVQPGDRHRRGELRTNHRQGRTKSVGPGVIVLPHALGANISGVITSAIFAATLIAFLLPKG